MDDFYNKRAEVLHKKFVLAEDERKCKSQIKKKIHLQKEKLSMQIHENSKIFYELQEKALDAYSKRENKAILKTAKENTKRFYSNITLHKKVIKQLLEQESKLIRNPKKPKIKFDKLPYLRKAQTKLLEISSLSGDEKPEDKRILDINFLKNYKSIKIRPSRINPNYLS